ncbi:MAG TPA: urea amidolyase associated protein UAAP1 [Ilumatobacteraceae bacterium]|nr:urea amidolyase associated protein UAAP1 [Ilumatobacteraceae bacterium]
MSTASLEGARDHARSQDGADAPTQRTVPPATAAALPPGVATSDVVWDETLGGGNYATAELRAGTVVRIVDTAGDACVHLVVHNAQATAERLNVADTVKVQWQAYLGPGAVLLSDMGRAMMTLVADTSGRHDALCGAASAAAVQQRYGQSGIHTSTPTARELLTVGAAKHDLTPRDLPTGVNLFKSATVAPDGALRFDGAAAPGRHVDLRCEMDLVVMLANVPHPLDPRPVYTSSAVRITAWRGARTAVDDPLRAVSPERRRAYENTDELLDARR